MSDLIHETMKQTRRYWYIDGISEMAAGLIILIIGGFFAIVPLIPSDSVRVWVLAVGQPALVILGVIFGSRVVGYIKERVTYPRTGYVAFRKKNRKRRWGRIALAMVLSASLGMLFSLLFNLISARWVPTIAAAFMSLFFLVIAYNLGLARFVGLAVYILAVGLLVSWWMPSEPVDMAAMMGLTGLGLLVSGAFTLRAYLGNTQPIDQDFS